MSEEIIKWMSIRECANALGVHPYTIQKKVRQGKLKAIKVGQKMYKVSDSDFKDYLESIKYNYEKKSPEEIEKILEERRKLNPSIDVQLK